MNQPSSLEIIVLGLELSKTNLELSKEEAILSLKIYFEEYSFELYDSLLIINIQTNQTNLTLESISKRIRKWLDRLAFTKAAFQILGRAKTSEDLLKQIIKGQISFDSFISWKKKGTFRITSKNLLHEKRPIQVIDFAKAISLYKDLGKVNLTNPDIDFTVLKGKEVWIGIKLWSQKDMFENRRSHLLAAPHPTGMSPRLARAMINLACAEKELLDPFCGAGGILIEGSLIGLNSIGIDFSKEMIHRAHLNTSQFENIDLFEQDALMWTKEVECVVTDVPYGKSSKLDQDLKQLILKFLEVYSNLTNTIVLCCPKTLKIRQLLKKTSWKVEFECDVYVHSSLTRNIVLLKN
ncbi:hypothetical protein COV13_01270 [Candidatus Woesearchaeota archaeon CG10_big_fil_rev_8_21_14_0_10_32_9]|nr:MAG: hypothetical protein COV13_01270 [Candidatus Woesearchaeota archaeon CG10_big_fil_rev_8_21_14_0_10_32_9]